jgi:hypothetical protein
LHRGQLLCLYSFFKEEEEGSESKEGEESGSKGCSGFKIFSTSNPLLD